MPIACWFRWCPRSVAFTSIVRGCCYCDRGRSIMKALTVCQGWTSLIFHPDSPKDIENRTWPTSYRGDLLIHSGKSKKSIAQSKEFCDRIGVSFPTDLVFGSILGIVELVGCRRNFQSNWAMPHHWHWVFANPRLFAEPIVCKGSLSLWTPSAEILEQIQGNINHE